MLHNKNKVAKGLGSQRFMTWMAFIVSVLLLGAYAGLVPVGHWQDEFGTFPDLVGGGWKEFWLRLIHWSPRPFSELLIFAYAHLVAHYQSPFIGGALAVLWTILLLGVIGVPLLAARQCFASRISRLQVLVLGMGFYCLLLLGHPVGEFFYWPQGAVAYIPVITALVAALWIFLFISMEGKAARLGVSVLLTLAALTAEVGAIFIIVLIGLIMGLFLVEKMRHRPVPNILWFSWLAMPALAAGGVLVAVHFGRLGAAHEIFGDPKVAHHFLPALAESIPTFFVQLAWVDEGRFGRFQFLWGTVSKILFLLAAYGILRPVILRAAGRNEKLLLLALGLACFATIFLTMVATYYQFGMMCCERHDTFRQGLVFLGLLSLAAFAAALQWRCAGAVHAQARPAVIAMLLAAMLIPALVSVPKLKKEYKSRGRHWSIAAINWQAGHGAGDHFTYLLMPPGPIIGGISLGLGTYTKDTDPVWLVRSMITYFNKQSITYASALETEAGLPSGMRRALLSPLLTPAPSCYVDLVNGQAYKGGAVHRSDKGSLALVGWTGPAAAAENGEIETWVVLTAQDGSKKLLRTSAMAREDVVSALKRPSLRNSGFQVTVDFNALPPGQTINLLSVSKNKAYDCGLRIEVQ